MIFDYVLGVNFVQTKGYQGKSGAVGYISHITGDSINYFSILNSSLIKSSLLHNAEGTAQAIGTEKESASFGLNEKIFKFFLHRNQLRHPVSSVRDAKGIDENGQIIQE